jgi:AraC-like DNA-binding protein
VAARVAADETIDWADLAIELGFADQAHLIRAFTATVGTSPAAYAREVHREDP